MSLIRLEVTPLVTLLAEILQDKSSGILTVVRQPRRRELHWANGDLVLIVSNDPAEGFWDFLVRRGLISDEQASELRNSDPLEIVPRFQALGVTDSMKRQILLREWLRALAVPLFSMDEGTAVFQSEESLDPARRILLQSTPAVVLDGIRAIANGLVLRSSLGDLRRSIVFDPSAPYALDLLPLTDIESRIANSLTEPETVDSFLKRFPSESVIAAKVVIAMSALGIFADASKQREEAPSSPLGGEDPTRDLELLAAIGPNDPRSLRLVALARQAKKVDYYKVLDLPRGAPNAQIVERCEWMKKEYEPSKFPPVVREFAQELVAVAEKALVTLSNPGRRHDYDKMLSKGFIDARSVEQQNARKRIANQNFERARDLSITGDYYGAIVLLRQAVNYDPGRSDAWLLLGSCQQHNPRWRRDAAESYHKALSIDPNSIDAMMSLGDLYRNEGLTQRAQSFYEDILKIDPEHEVAKKRMKAMT